MFYINKKTIISLWSVGLFFIISLHLQGQSQEIEKIIEKLNLFNKRYPEETVYLQTDRTKYAPGEDIWFMAHVMDDPLNQSVKRSKNLFVALVDQYGQEVVSQKYIIEKNQVKDNISIPNTLSDGSYMLAAYSIQLVNSPVDRVFFKKIMIEREDKNKIFVEIRLKDTIYNSNSELTATVRFYEDDNSPVGARFNYHLNGEHTGEIIKGKGKADENGTAEIKIALPDFNSEKNVIFYVEAIYKGSKAEAGILIPTQLNYINVRFYPEGGKLISGVESKIAFSAFNSCNQPVDFEGEILDQKNNAVKKIESSYEGMGNFLLTTENGQKYYLKIIRPAGIIKTFDLPLPVYNGLALSVVSEKNNIIKFQVMPVNLEGKVYYFIGQTKGKIYWIKSEKIEQTSVIEIPIEEFPMGLAQFAVFDQSMDLLAERSVFINNDKKLNIEIIQNKSVYAPGEKAIIQVKVKDQKGEPVSANISLAAANNEFVKSCSGNNNFLTYASLACYLKGYFPTPSFYFNNTETSRKILDDLAIINSSGRFSWHEILNLIETDPSVKIVDNVADLNTIKSFDREKDNYLASVLDSELKYPGNSFPIYEKNDLKKLMSKNKVSDQKIQTGYTSDQNIFDIIRQIKPYQMVGGKIIFASSGINSIAYQSGALIVIDGVMMGTDAQILNTIPVTDIERINASNNPADIQRYTALNNIGIIEIFTKKGGELKESSADSTAEKAEKQKASTGRTYFWSPGIQTDDSGIATFSYINGDQPSDVTITVEGIAKSGFVGTNNIKYSIK
jgi:hypothetical protein